jgi:molybdate transport system substrate-binding protein
MRMPIGAAHLALVVLLAQGVTAEGAEIRVIGLAGMTPLMNELGPRFERATGHRLIMRFGSGAEGKRLIEAGEAFDLAVLNPVLIDELTKQEKIAAGTRTEIFRNGTGVVIRAGASRPDIGSSEAFKQALLNAKSVAYSPGRASGIHVAKVFEQLGIAEQMKAKTRPQQAPEHVARAVADYIVFTAGLGSKAAEPQAARVLLEFLKSETAKSVMKAQGLEPL